jgi:hypothetical protein
LGSEGMVVDARRVLVSLSQPLEGLRSWLSLAPVRQIEVTPNNRIEHENDKEHGSRRDILNSCNS